MFCFLFLLTDHPSPRKVSRRGKMMLKVASVKKVTKRNISREWIPAVHCPAILCGFRPSYNRIQGWSDA